MSTLQWGQPSQKNHPLAEKMLMYLACANSQGLELILLLEFVIRLRLENCADSDIRMLTM